jgi:ABC-type multidrug transport system fused ATPase/permease subunit
VIKLFAVLVLLAALAFVIFISVMIVTGQVNKRRQTKLTRKQSEQITNTNDAAWLYANGASLTDIKLAEAQRRLLE